MNSPKGNTVGQPETNRMFYPGADPWCRVRPTGRPLIAIHVRVLDPPLPANTASARTGLCVSLLTVQEGGVDRARKQRIHLDAAVWRARGSGLFGGVGGGPECTAPQAPAVALTCPCPTPPPATWTGAAVRPWRRNMRPEPQSLQRSRHADVGGAEVRRGAWERSREHGTPPKPPHHGAI